MSTVQSFVLRKLNRTKAALLLAEARHTDPDHKPGFGKCHDPDGPLPRCELCVTIRSLRKEVSAGEIALKQAEAIR